MYTDHKLAANKGWVVFMLGALLAASWTIILALAHFAGIGADSCARISSVASIYYSQANQKGLNAVDSSIAVNITEAAQKHLNILNDRFGKPDSHQSRACNMTLTGIPVVVELVVTRERRSFKEYWISQDGKTVEQVAYE